MSEDEYVDVLTCQLYNLFPVKSYSTWWAIITESSYQGYGKHRFCDTEDVPCTTCIIEDYKEAGKDLFYALTGKHRRLFKMNNVKQPFSIRTFLNIITADQKSIVKQIPSIVKILEKHGSL